MKTRLDDLGSISKLDSSNMLGAVERFPDPFAGWTGGTGLESNGPISGLRSVVLMGMGGSASAGDVVVDWLRDDLEIPVFVHREPGLPGYVDSKTLFVAISYSGDTSETLASFRAARARHAHLVGVGTGGKLEGLCNDSRAPYLRVDSTVAPRAALSQLTVALARVFESFGLVRSTSRELLEAGRELSKLERRIRVEIPIENNPAKRLSSKLIGHFLVIYSLQRMSSVARRFKNQLAENCKQVAKYDVLPESCHNEIEAWRTYPDHALPLLIRDTDESVFERSSIGAFRSTIDKASKERPVDVRVSSIGKLSRLLCPIFFLDYASVYLALLNRIDPTPTHLIDTYKARLKSRRG